MDVAALLRRAQAESAKRSHSSEDLEQSAKRRKQNVEHLVDANQLSGGEKSASERHRGTVTMSTQYATPRPRLQNLNSGLLDMVKYTTWQSDLQRAHEYTPLVTQLYTDSIYRKEEARGDERLREIEDTIQYFFPKGRFHFQVDLHNQMLRATLMQTLGDDYRMLVQQVCRERGWSGPNKNLFTIASRRSGKTTGISSMCAALLICVPNIQIVVYSVAKRSAEEFVRLVEKYMQMHPTGREMIKNPGGAEMLVVEGFGAGDERRIRSFPSGGNAANVSVLSFSFTLCIFFFLLGLAGPQFPLFCIPCTNTGLLAS